MKPSVFKYLNIIFFLICISSFSQLVFGQDDNSLTMYQFFTPLISGIASGTVIAVILNVIFKKRMDTIQEQIRSQFEIIRSQREWKERSIAELLGPICMLLNRTSLAFKRWDPKNSFLEAEVIAKSNQKIRDILLDKGYLIPSELLPDALKFVEHYDRWLEEFNKIRVESIDETKPFVFTGPEGYPFPKESEENFKKCFKEYWEELYKPK